MKEPKHLGRFSLEIDSAFDNDEYLFRRCPTTGQEPPFELETLFLQIKIADIKQGLSVNRAKYSSYDDAFWSTTEDVENKKCTYHRKNCVVYVSKAGYYPSSINPSTGIVLSLIHSPENCNYSHCDIFSTPNESTNWKQKIEIRAFLATFFEKPSATEKNVSIPE